MANPMHGQLPATPGRAPLFFVDRFDWPSHYRMLILGQTGCGKTYLEKRPMDQKYGKVPLVVYQSKPRVGSLDKLDCVRVKSNEKLAKYLRGNKREPLVIFKPTLETAQLRETTEEFCRLMLYSKGPLIAVIDETSHFTSFSPLPSVMFAALITQGRELGKGVIMAAQEPAYLPRMVYAECSTIFRMYVHGGTNLKALRDKLPYPLAVEPLPNASHALTVWDIRDREHAYAFRRAV